MTAKNFGKIHICVPKVISQVGKILYCPKCKTRRRVKLNLYEWYSPDGYCKAMRKRGKKMTVCDYRFQFN